jgi:hypothetical protein
MSENTNTNENAGLNTYTPTPCSICDKDSEPNGGFCEMCDEPYCEDHAVHEHHYGFCSQKCSNEWAETWI